MILGSHAVHDRWSAAGNDAGRAGLLWSLSVAVEFVVFVFIGRSRPDRLSPAHAAMLAAAAGIVRWAVMAETRWFPALAMIEPLHGITFALLHLTCMPALAQCTPRHLVAAALKLYGTLGIGLPTVLLTLASGELYGQFRRARVLGVMAASAPQRCPSSAACAG
ncbi:MAG: MFS transporter [Alphaproteobacteria bacterium]|nr:MFS transporter [Alphaproteobacteria bacterium]